MEFAAVALRTLLPKLAQLLQDEYNLHKGVRKDIQFLSDELLAINAALDKVGEVPRDQLQNLQKIWAQDLRELSYDMEDVVDTFMVNIKGPNPPSKRSVKRMFKEMIRKVTKYGEHRKIAQEIKDIKKRLSEVTERRDRYNLLGAIRPANVTRVDPRIKALYANMTELVGIDEAKQDVITRLTNGDAEQQESRIVLSIAGFGGLGKTTLAKAVHDEIEGQFDCTAFVPVSRTPDAKRLLKDMLYQLYKEGHHPGANLDEITHLIELVREFLKNKRYLSIIDDIWAREPWKDFIELALIENNKRSRIIITTRNIDVAQNVGSCYRVKPLSHENSEKLFYSRLFISKDKCPGRILEVSQKILKKCGGVPLAINTTSSLLANKSENKKEWDKVCSSIGSGICGSNDSMKDMGNILLLSYYDLPSNLKPCLLYLSTFPEDYEITKDVLMWRWVAEGFVVAQQGQQPARDQITSLKIGESYFNELINRNLIQLTRMDVEGTPRACRVHDIVLDLIISLSAEEGFITTTVLGDGMEDKIRRLSLQNDTSWPTKNLPKLRSLTVFQPFNNLSKPVGIVTDPSLSRYPLLRVLDLRDFELQDLASLGFLGSLSHLRYLGLASSADRYMGSGGHDCDRLPEEIGQLHFLQTLDLSRTAVKELPSRNIGCFLTIFKSFLVP